ncbi:histidine kinase [Micromonospora lupini]|uniref:sensor histidine kinase n=1 Tax=Micromonospora lupini TaxID=285679 RepID=UPI003400331F
MHDVTAGWGPAWLRWHLRAWLGDLVLATALFVLVLKLDERPVTGWAIVLAALAAVAAPVRRWYPQGALVAVTALAACAILTGLPASGLVITLGVLTYSAALYSPRRRPWFYAALVWGTLIVAGSLAHFSQWWSPQQFGLFAWLFGGAGAGDSTRMRRAYIAEVTKRARQAEMTREEEARRRVMDERLRIARELHDVVAHHIAVISVHVGAADHVLRNDPDRVWPVLGHIRLAADTVLEEIKSVISVLRDPYEMASTEPAPGMDRLDDLLDGLRATGFRVRHQLRGTARPLPAVVDLAAYRILQEALTNAHRYGDGTAELAIEFTADAVTVEVTNQISVPGPHHPGSGFGLLGMRERAAAAHGTLTAAPVEGGRFRVYAVLPADEHTISLSAPVESRRASVAEQPGV